MWQIDDFPGWAGSQGAVRAEASLDVDRLTAAKEKGRSVASTAGQKGHEFIPAGDLVEIDCDLPVPAALENMIHADNAGSVKAKLVLELAAAEAAFVRTPAAPAETMTDPRHKAEDDVARGHVFVNSLRRLDTRSPFLHIVQNGSVLAQPSRPSPAARCRSG